MRGFDSTGLIFLCVELVEGLAGPGAEAADVAGLGGGGAVGDCGPDAGEAFEGAAPLGAAAGEVLVGSPEGDAKDNGCGLAELEVFHAFEGAECAGGDFGFEDLGFCGAAFFAKGIGEIGFGEGGDAAGALGDGEQGVGGG